MRRDMPVSARPSPVIYYFQSRDWHWTSFSYGDRWMPGKHWDC